MSQHHHHSQLFSLQTYQRQDSQLLGQHHHQQQQPPSQSHLQQTNASLGPYQAQTSSQHGVHRRHQQHEHQSGPLTANPLLRKGRWSPTEDQRLLSSIRIHGPNKWKQVAKDVGSRSGDQCWKRWNDSLDPNLDHSQWTPSEDQILEEAVLHAGRLWSKIAGENLPGRSGLSCKNRWDHIQRKQRRLHQSQRDVLQGHGGGTSRSFIDSTFFSEQHRGSLASSTSATAGVGASSAADPAAAAAVSSSSASASGLNLEASGQGRVQSNSEAAQRRSMMLSLEPKHEHGDDARSLVLSRGAHRNSLYRTNQMRGYASMLGSTWGAASSHGNQASGNTSTLSPYVSYQTSFSSPMADSRTLPTTNSYSSPYPPTSMAIYPFQGSMSVSSGTQQRGGVSSSSSNHIAYQPAYSSQNARNGANQHSQLLTTLDPGSCTGGMLTYPEEGTTHQTGEASNYQHTNTLASNGPLTNTTAGVSTANGFLHSFTTPSSQSQADFPDTSWPSRVAQPSTNLPRYSFSSHINHPYFMPKLRGGGGETAGRSYGVPLPFHTKPTAEETQEYPLQGRMRDHLESGRSEQLSPSALYVPTTACSSQSTSLSGQAWSSTAGFHRETMTTCAYQTNKSSTSHPFAFSPGPTEVRPYPGEDVKRERFLETRESVLADRRGEGEGGGGGADFAPPALAATVAASPAPSRDELISSARESEPLASPCPLPRAPKVEEMANSLFCDDFQYRDRLEQHRRVEDNDDQDDDVTSEEEEGQLSSAPKQQQQQHSQHPAHAVTSSPVQQNQASLHESRLADFAQRPSHYL